jgi:hypothetical protein
VTVGELATVTVTVTVCVAIPVASLVGVPVASLVGVGVGVGAGVTVGVAAAVVSTLGGADDVRTSGAASVWRTVLVTGATALLATARPGAASTSEETGRAEEEEAGPVGSTAGVEDSSGGACSQLSSSLEVAKLVGPGGDAFKALLVSTRLSVLPEANTAMAGRPRIDAAIAPVNKVLCNRLQLGEKLVRAGTVRSPSDVVRGTPRSGRPLERAYRRNPRVTA